MYNRLAKRVAGMLQTATPLDDYHSIPTKHQPRTIGYGKESDPDFMAEATAYFRARNESWAIIVSDNPAAREVQQYVARNPKLRRSKILLVSTDAGLGDNTDAKAVVFHDLIGHSMAMELTLPYYPVATELIFQALPSNFKVFNEPQRSIEIYAAVFFGVDLKQLARDAKELALGNPLVNQQIDEVLTVCKKQTEEWVQTFKPGKPRGVHPWL